MHFVGLDLGGVVYDALGSITIGGMVCMCVCVCMHRGMCYAYGVCWSAFMHGSHMCLSACECVCVHHRYQCALVSVLSMCVGSCGPLSDLAEQ